MNETSKALVSAEEQLLRAEDVRRIRHSTEMEGGFIPIEAQAYQDAFVRGEIDEEEMVRRARERFGLGQ